MTCLGSTRVRCPRVILMSPLTHSLLLSGSSWSAEDAWQLREGRKKRYNGQRLGGTIVVHFIKKHMWYFETVLALLGGEEETEYEIQRRIRQEPLRERESALSQIALHRRTARVLDVEAS